MSEDQKAIQMAKEGNPAGLKILVDKYYQTIYRFAFLRVQDRDIALDLVQEAFYKFYKNVKNFDKNKKFLPYMIQIVKNLHHNFKYRYVNRMRKIEDFIFTAPDAPEKKLLEDETHQLLLEALKKLSPDEQMLLMLREFEDYSYEDLAEYFHVSIGTIMSRLHYTRKKLKKAFLGVSHEKV